jgi:diguanylate cyclase (GGDEF)-like protein
MHRPSRQLVMALRGEPSPGGVPGSFSDDGFNEAEHEARVSNPPSPGGAYFHAERALSAAIYGDTERLIRHAGAAMVQLPRIPGYHVTVWAYLFQSLALAERLRAMPAEEQAPVLKELDVCRSWFTARAKDAPVNYLHLQRLVEAERAWAVGDGWGAAAGYNAAMSEVEHRNRPWQAALITERAALFHLSQGLEHTGRPLLDQARSMYQAWGATGKVREMLQQHSFLSRGSGGRRSEPGARSTLVSDDAVDVMSVLRASQALSSETSLDKLRSRVAKVLCAMTGAASVLMVVRHEDGEERVLSEDAADLTVRAAEAQGLLPMSAYRYAVRTQEPLLINDATRDERFSRDPYLAGLPHCSLLLVPVLSHGQLRAVLVLENRQRRGAFSADRLETVTLIAGQLSVSLDNALLYDSLERKVAERTAALEAANQRLEVLSVTDALTGVANRRRFAEALDAEWLRARRTGTPIGLAMIDIDQFKLYNDHYGHQGGDACLTMVADAMKRGLRAGSDLIARYGGEEFVLLLPNTDLPGTLTVAERVRAAVATLAAPHALSGHGIVTVSIGIVSFVPDDSNSASQFIEVADTALYAAKRGGRNQVKSGLS